MQIIGKKLIYGVINSDPSLVFDFDTNFLGPLNSFIYFCMSTLESEMLLGTHENESVASSQDRGPLYKSLSE